MSRPQSAVRLPAAAVREFEKAVNAGWEEVPLTGLLKRVNRVVARLLPEENGRDSRVSRVFKPRSFRHYQTLGCIDPPGKDGRQAVYGMRHFVQALLVRKLLWERVPAERIVELMAGRSTEETRQLLFGGVEIVARQAAGEGTAAATVADAVESWKRIGVVPGVELHLRGDLARPKPAELKKWLALLETAMRRNLK